MLPKLHTELQRDKKSEVQLLLEKLGFVNPALKYLMPLCQCEGDVNVFYKYFYTGDKRNLLNEIMLYRTHLIKSRNYEITHFVTSYRMDKRKAMERLFMLPIDNETIREIDTFLTEGRLDLTEIYLSHLKEPELNAMLLIKRICNL